MRKLPPAPELWRGWHQAAEYPQPDTGILVEYLARPAVWAMVEAEQPETCYVRCRTPDGQWTQVCFVCAPD